MSGRRQDPRTRTHQASLHDTHPTSADESPLIRSIIAISVSLSLTAFIIKGGKVLVYCAVVGRLSDVDLAVLEQIIRESSEFIESKSHEGPIREILWKRQA